MAQVKIGDAHGLYRVVIGNVGRNGYNYGTAGQNAEPGTTLPGYVIRYPQNGEFQMPDRTVIDFTGGDVWTGAYVYGITSLGTFQVTLSVVDATLIAFTSGSKVDQVSNSRWTGFAENVMRPTPPQSWMILNYRLQSKEQGSKGADLFMNTIIPRCWINPKGLSGAPAFQSAGQYGLQVIPTVSDRLPHGLAFTADAQGFEENETPVMYFITENPLYLVGHIADPTAGVDYISLPYKPVSYDYTTPDSSSDPVQVLVNGVPTNATSIDEETGFLEVGGLTEGDYIGVLYETLYRRVA